MKIDALGNPSLENTADNIYLGVSTFHTEGSQDLKL